jgi:hypothetical protein
VQNNLEASSLPSLSPAAHQQLRQLYDEKIKEKIRGHY